MGNEQSTPGATSSSPDAASSAHASPLQAAADARDVAWSPCATAKNACPAPRVGAGAVLDDGTLVVIGGHSNEEEFGDVWALGAADETQWVKREPAGQAPRVRGGHSVVYDPNHGLVVFGGISHERGGYLADVQVLAPDLSAWLPVCATGELPCGRDKHSAVLAPGHRMLVFGGFGVQPPPEEEEDEDEDEDEHEDDEVKEGGKADVSEGKDDADEEPGHAEGGEGRGPSVDLGWFSDVYSLDLPTMRWTRLVVTGLAPPAPTSDDSGGVWGALAKKAAAAQPRTPAARAAHACAVLAPDLDGMEASSSGGATGMMMLLFGGRAATGRLNDLWVLEGLDTAPTWRQPEVSGAAPAPRSFHACTAVGAGCVAIYGGLDASGVHQNDLHLLHLPSTGPSAAAMPPASWAWVRVRQAGAMPSPRASPLLASRRMLTSSIITFGGSANPTEHGDATFFNDAYRLDLEPLLSALDSAQAAADAATASSAAQRDAPEVETEGIDPDATAALHTAKKPRVETHEEIETSEEDAAGSARKDGPPIAPEAVVATPMPAVPPVTFDFSKVPALDPRTGGLA